MREIKFRAWDKNSVVMLYPPKCWASSNKNKFQLVSEHGNFIIGDEYVMQYTGLKDKNGKEIYEGDIVKCFDLEYLDMPDFVGTITIDDCEFYLKDKNDNAIELWSDGTHDYFTLGLIQTNECCEIIGNIYENKELLQCK